MLARKVVYLALNGQQWAVEFIANRTEGKVPDTFEADATVDGSVIRIRVPDEVESE